MKKTQPKKDLKHTRAGASVPHEVKHARPPQEKHEPTLDDKYAEACAILPAQKRKVGTDEAKIEHIALANAL